MFNIGMLELVVVLLVAFLVVGPKDLPKVARWIARMVRKGRDYVDQFKDDFGLNDLGEELKDTKDQLKDAVDTADVAEDMKETQEALRAIAEGVDYDMKRTAKEIEKAAE